MHGIRYNHRAAPLILQLPGLQKSISLEFWCFADYCQNEAVWFSTSHSLLSDSGILQLSWQSSSSKAVKSRAFDDTHQPTDEPNA